MTAGGAMTGLHKRWLERRLEIEVDKVQAKLLSKGLTVPEPDADTLEAGARLAHSHLPKLCIELYGRNPNGTVKPHPEPPPRAGPSPPPTLVEKLDRLLNPAILSPLPAEVVAAHGLQLTPLDPPDWMGGHGMASPLQPAGGPAMNFPQHYPATPPSKQGAMNQFRASQSGALAGGGGGGIAGMSPQQAQVYRPHSGGASGGVDPAGTFGSGGAAGGGGGSVGAGGGDYTQRTARSAPQPVHWRPDLQGADARIDDAMAEVQRIAMQANEMTPRERVLYLARQVNPDFMLPQPRFAHMMSMAHEHGRSRKDLTRSSKKRLTSFSPSPDTGMWAGNTAAARQSVAGSVSRRRSSGGGQEPRRGRDGYSVVGSSSGGTSAGDAVLPPLGGGRTKSISIGSAAVMGLESLEGAGGVAAAAVAGAILKGETVVDGLPPLGPAYMSEALTDGEARVSEHSSVGGGVPPQLPPIPARHTGNDIASTDDQANVNQIMADAMISLWMGAPIDVIATKAAAAAAAAEAAAASAAAAAAEAASAEPMYSEHADSAKRAVLV